MTRCDLLGGPRGVVVGDTRACIGRVKSNGRHLSNGGDVERRVPATDGRTDGRNERATTSVRRF